jgi:UDP-2-acetamido-3-amino-2,3-dideoxy-glucuronate N-acetyltransferase
MNYFVHPNGICETADVGENTRIWAFAHILSGARIGRDCNICDHVFVENDVQIGDRVTVKCGVQLWDGISVGDDAFLGPNATFTNDPFPRSRQQPQSFSRTIVGPGASIGANATILPGISIGSHAMVGAGAVVVHSVPANAIVVGNPARIVGYTNHGQRNRIQPLDVSSQPGGPSEIAPTSVRGVNIHRLLRVQDIRGEICVGEFERNVPFKPLRYFLVFEVPSKEVRGEHAHRRCHQFLVCVRGSVAVIVDDGRKREEILLEKPEIGLHLPPMTWGIQYKYTDDAMLLVFASEYYDSSEYIRDYDEFLGLAGAN